MNIRIIRRTLTVLVLMLLLMRLRVVAFLLLYGWGTAELFRFGSRYGKKGYVAAVAITAIFASFVTYQAYLYSRNLELIAKIESIGDSYATMSGRLLVGPVTYVSLGDDVGDAELAMILALEGLDRLNTLIAKETLISDQGLLLLQDCKHLKRIYLSGSGITQTGVDRLQQQRPDCAITYRSDESTDAPASIYEPIAWPPDK